MKKVVFFLSNFGDCAFSGSFHLVPVDGAMEQKAGGLSRILCQCCGGLPLGWAGLCPSVPVLCVLPLVPVDRAQTGGRGRCRGSTHQKLILL